MGYLVSFGCALLLVASPVGVRAQHYGSDHAPRLVYADTDLALGSVASIVVAPGLLEIRKRRPSMSDEATDGSTAESLGWSDLQWLQWLLEAEWSAEPAPSQWPAKPLSEGSSLRIELDGGGIRVIASDYVTAATPTLLQEAELKRTRGIAIGVTVTVLVVVAAVVTAVLVSNSLSGLGEPAR